MDHSGGFGLQCISGDLDTADSMFFPLCVLTHMCPSGDDLSTAGEASAANELDMTFAHFTFEDLTIHNGERSSHTVSHTQIREISVVGLSVCTRLPCDYINIRSGKGVFNDYIAFDLHPS